MGKLLAIFTILLTFFALPVQAGETLDYKPGLIQDALDNGKILFVDYATTWCPTCKSQERTIERLRAENPQYNDVLTFVRVEWDDYKKHAVSTSRNIPRRSTLLVLKGDQELGRLVAETNKEKIKHLMDLAFEAAS